jgi:hypothetical protein
MWAALLMFSAAALKCTVRDQWIGWSYRHQYDRLKLVVNNSHFLICHSGISQTWDHESYRCAKKEYKMTG